MIHDIGNLGDCGLFANPGNFLESRGFEAELSTLQCFLVLFVSLLFFLNDPLNVGAVTFQRDDLAPFCWQFLQYVFLETTSHEATAELFLQLREVRASRPVVSESSLCACAIPLCITLPVR